MKIFILIAVLSFLTSVQAQPVVYKLTDLGLRGAVKSVLYNYFENNGTAESRAKGNPVKDKYTGQDVVKKYEFNEDSLLVSFADRKLTYKEKQIHSVIPLGDGFDSFPVTYYIDSRINRITTVEREGGLQECVYDTGGKLMEIRGYTWDNQSSGWLDDIRTVFTYDEKGLKKTESVSLLDELQSKTVYDYDKDGLLLKATIYDSKNTVMKSFNGLPDLENMLIPKGTYTDIDMTGNWLVLVYFDVQLNKSIIVERTIVYY
jgi:hypothetical protein